MAICGICLIGVNNPSFQVDFLSICMPVSQRATVHYYCVQSMQKRVHKCHNKERRWRPAVHNHIFSFANEFTTGVAVRRSWLVVCSVGWLVAAASMRCVGLLSVCKHQSPPLLVPSASYELTLSSWSRFRHASIFNFCEFHAQWPAQRPIHRCVLTWAMLHSDFHIYTWIQWWTISGLKINLLKRRKKYTWIINV